MHSTILSFERPIQILRSDPIPYTPRKASPRPALHSLPISGSGLNIPLVFSVLGFRVHMGIERAEPRRYMRLDFRPRTRLVNIDHFATVVGCVYSTIRVRHRGYGQKPRYTYFKLSISISDCRKEISFALMLLTPRRQSTWLGISITDTICLLSAFPLVSVSDFFAPDLKAIIQRHSNSYASHPRRQRTCTCT